MFPIKKTGLALAIAATAWAGLAAQGAATSDSDAAGGLLTSTELNLKEMICWDLVTMAQDDRGYALVLLYGFARGEKGQAQFSPRAIQIASVNTIQECLDKPNAKALDVMKTHIIE